MGENSILLEAEVLGEMEGIKIFSPRGVKLPFYRWSSDNPVFASIEIGWPFACRLQNISARCVNVFFALCSLTAGGRVGVCARHSTLEELSSVGSRRIMEPLSALRRKRWLTWGFVNENLLVPGEKKSVRPMKVFWLNRRLIIA